MEKFNFEGYRDNLAEDLKAFRAENSVVPPGRIKGDPRPYGRRKVDEKLSGIDGRKMAKKVLKEEIGSIRYKKAKELHIADVEKFRAKHPLERKLETGNKEGAQEIYGETLEEFKNNLADTLSSGKMLEPENLNMLFASALIPGIGVESSEDIDKIDWQSLLKRVLGAREVKPEYNNRDARKWSWWPNSERKGDGVKSFDLNFVPKDLIFKFNTERMQKILEIIKETNNGKDITPLLEDEESSKQVLLHIVFEKLMGKIELSSDYEAITEVFAGLDDKIYCRTNSKKIFGEGGREWRIPNFEDHAYVHGVLPEGFPIVRYEGRKLKYYDTGTKKETSVYHGNRRFLMIGDQVIETVSQSCAGEIMINSNEKGETESIELGGGNDRWYKGSVLFKEYEVPVLVEKDRDDVEMFRTLPGIENGGKPSFSFKKVRGSSDWIKEEVEDEVMGGLTVRQLNEINTDPEKLKNMKQEIEKRCKEKKKEVIVKELDAANVIEGEIIK